MADLDLHHPIREFAAAMRLNEIIPPAEFEIGLTQLEAEIERIALDAHTARLAGLTFSEAASDFVNYPYLARVHVAIDNMLTMSLPPRLAKWVQTFLSMPQPPSLNNMRTALVATAVSSDNPRLEALARFALFEGVRLNLVVMARWFPTETFGVGLEMIDLDKIAEERTAEWLAQEPVVPDDVRPFHVIVAAALQTLGERADELHRALAELQRDFVEEVQLRGTVEEVLGEMDVRDALLIRNELAPSLGEQHLTIERLQERHLMVLGNVETNTLHVRSGRARSGTRDSLRRKRVALLDLFREAKKKGDA
jgi:hypothetical protein